MPVEEDYTCECPCCGCKMSIKDGKIQEFEEVDEIPENLAVEINEQIIYMSGYLDAMNQKIDKIQVQIQKVPVIKKE